MNNNFPGEAQNDQRVADFWTTYLVRIATLVVCCRLTHRRAVYVYANAVHLDAGDHEGQPCRTAAMEGPAQAGSTPGKGRAEGGQAGAGPGRRESGERERGRRVGKSGVNVIGPC